eukprot:CAMPEP_0170443592 /NCGR_PEP_ID=MMETSP0117_2-20130122/48062_1 /TAXON_ID=400756 /ORGANISM="Durinskia baltica, Strain CSIRO CS-38" /LENGTH=109 /DNA_ID=CAMNT_0010704315 /DNA_START=301 /DNA_END=628 /DNA_ORIENTATION=-
MLQVACPRGEQGPEVAPCPGLQAGRDALEQHEDEFGGVDEVPALGSPFNTYSMNTNEDMHPPKTMTKGRMGTPKGLSIIVKTGPRTHGALAATLAQVDQGLRRDTGTPA